MNNKYKKLVNNSLIFAIGNFGSKVMSFVMVPIYSYALSTGDFGKVDLLTALVSLLMPIVSLDIYDAVFRFALDKSSDKRKVFSTGLVFTLLMTIPIFIIGWLVSLRVTDYPVIYTVIYLIVSIFGSLTSNFSRAIGYVRQYAIAGILTTLVLGISNILLLIVFKCGMDGYMISLILSQIASVLFLFVTAHLYQELSFTAFQKALLREMLIYGLPLIPNSFAWWLNSASDRFFITALIGAGANGIYAMANKIPTVISTISGIFFQSWQMSVVEEYEKKDGEKFISYIFSLFLSVLFFLGIGVVTIIRPLFRMVISHNYFLGWKLTPALVLAVMYTCLALFLGTIYTASKRTVSVLVTTIYGAIINVVLSIVLLKAIGVNGAAIANAVSFATVTILRIREISAAGKLRINWKNLILIHVLFAIVCVVLFISSNDLIVFVTGMIVLLAQLMFDRELKETLLKASSGMVKRFAKR